MSTDDREFERFARRLDEEWVRERLRTVAPPPLALEEVEGLARDLASADPLVQADQPGWLDAVREALGFWPARLAVGTAVVALLVVGFVVGRVAHDVGQERVTAVAPPLPAYEPEAASRTRLGAVPSVAPESERKFREAMAFHGAPDFASRALPLLSDAVASDPSNDQAQFWLGVALLFKRQAGDAVPHLEKARELAPGSRRYKQYLLFAYLQISAADKAAKLQAELVREEVTP